MSTRARPILLVDDDLDIREVLTETLEEEGFEVVTATNGLDAIQVIRRMTPPPAIILLDLMMPIMDGYGFLEQRDKDARLASIPVAIVTAGYGVDRSRLGNAVIIPKPIDLPKLVGVLHRHVGSKAESPA